ncbi:iron-sulfur cluster repair di-iron protein [Danxiaibacter flavus]|uniref:Iron-sulfur cluster repair di-iron protein n=1 Tax=Danxiaibacter flavus TaxID=3049108 RepID=A0ABV3ZME6_9BACT|nr:iron-sulfur cluster repair di-iron protein [Chitinophagaceae bacterium DXS]
MSTNLIVDVTTIEPVHRHAAIFNLFDNLGDGEALTIRNDHDPKPLYYELRSARGASFSWTYLQEGPLTWEVEIKKEALNNAAETIGEMARKNFRKAEVFKKLGIDYCCGGKKTVEEACAKHGLDVESVKRELEKAEQPGSASAVQHDFDSWPLSFLADYIVNVHHKYVRESTQLLDELSEKVARKHSDKFAELPEIRRCVVELLNELTTHMVKEERILFPYIKHTEQGNDSAGPFKQTFDSIEKPIWVMEQDHEVAGDLLRQLRELTNGYSVPPNACNSFNFLYKKLEEFEGDLHQHIHLENNILFPKVIQLEESKTVRE